MSEPQTILAIASYDKGADFLRQCKRSGWRTLLLTSESLRGDHSFPVGEIDDIFYMPDDNKVWNTEHTIRAVSYLARTEQIARIVPMDDFDLENAAALREHLRIPGMGSTTTHHFRDKLAMRMQAKEAGLSIPEFCGVIHHATVHEFTRRVPGPWVLKPRFLAGALGIKKAENADELWRHINGLGDQSSFYLVEKYIPGDIFHVDALTEGGKQLFARASGYGRPPLDVTHGDIFTTRTLDPRSETAQALVRANTDVLEAMRLVRGASHTEFAGRRREHHRPGRGGHRREPVGRVGEARAGRRRRELPGAHSEGRPRGAHGDPGEAGVAGLVGVRRSRGRLAHEEALPRGDGRKVAALRASDRAPRFVPRAYSQ